MLFDQVVIGQCGRCARGWGYRQRGIIPEGRPLDMSIELSQARSLVNRRQFGLTPLTHGHQKRPHWVTAQYSTVTICNLNMDAITHKTEHKTSPPFSLFSGHLHAPLTRCGLGADEKRMSIGGK